MAQGHRRAFVDPPTLNSSLPRWRCSSAVACGDVAAEAAAGTASAVLGVPLLRPNEKPELPVAADAEGGGADTALAALGFAEPDLRSKENPVLDFPDSAAVLVLLRCCLMAAMLSLPACSCHSSVWLMRKIVSREEVDVCMIEDEAGKHALRSPSHCRRRWH